MTEMGVTGSGMSRQLSNIQRRRDNYAPDKHHIQGFVDYALRKLS
jgi:hypothetical protein